MMTCWSMDQLGRDHLALRSMPVPEPGPGGVLVKVAAVSLNYRDLLVIDDTYRNLPIGLPFTPASDMCGTIVAVGKDVIRFGKGDRVISVVIPEWIDGPPLGSGQHPANKTLGGFHPGVLAEYVALPQNWLVAAPTSLSDIEASTLTAAGITAWAALVEQNRVRPGATVLIQGTGGVALFALKIAKILGAEVIVTSGSSDKLERVRALGADHCIDRTATDWVEEVFRITGGRGVDHIIELAGGPGLAQSVAAVTVGGRIQIAGGLDRYEVSAPTPPILLKAVTMQGVLAGPRRALEDFVRAVDANGLKPVIAHRYAFNELPQALKHLQAGAFGKIVLGL